MHVTECLNIIDVIKRANSNFNFDFEGLNGANFKIFKITKLFLLKLSKLGNKKKKENFLGKSILKQLNVAIKIYAEAYLIKVPKI